MEFPVFQSAPTLHCLFTRYCWNSPAAPSLHSFNRYLCKFTRSVTMENSTLLVFTLFKNTSMWEFLVAVTAVQWTIQDGETCTKSQYRKPHLSPILAQSFTLLNCSFLVQAQVSVQLHGETTHSASTGPQIPLRYHNGFFSPTSFTLSLH